MTRGPWQWLRALDRFANALLGGDGSHTISARIGYAVARGKVWAKVAAPLVDALFGAGHCRASAVAEGLIPA